MLKFIVFVLLLFGLCAGWDTTFKYRDCYEKDVQERLPLSIDNLIAILEKYESARSVAYDDIASGILKRYRTNGIAFDTSLALEWSAHQASEILKQDLDDKLLKHAFELAEDSFTPEEECSLHLMVSHATDTYPHAGSDYPWENYKNTREKRSYRKQYGDEETEVADHPIEFGVIQTRAGPVAAGLLLAGIMSVDRAPVRVGELIGEENSDLFPSRMMQATVDPLYGTTISGELAQAAILTARKVDSDFEIGPIGKFGNCSACARIFTLAESEFSHLSRAEIYGAIDGLIIGNFLKNKKYGTTSSLAEALRMYYSNHGLFNPELRACQRQKIFNEYVNNQEEIIRQEAINYMFAYQNYVRDIREIFTYQDTFEEVESICERYLDKIFPKFMNFMTKTNMHEQPGYEECPDDENDIRIESVVDLLVVFSPLSSQETSQNQAEYIALTARKIGVGYRRSRIGILHGGRRGENYQMTNHSNIAEFSCRYTTDIRFTQSSSQKFVEVMERLIEYYSVFFGEQDEEDQEKTSSHSQVVLWNLPESFEEEEEEIIEVWRHFNETFPDVTFIFAGESDSMINMLYQEEFGNEDDLLFVNTNDEPDYISDELEKVIKRAPRMFYYPNCGDFGWDFEDNEVDNNEDDHVYRIFVSPGFTNFIRIPPEMFHYSETLKLIFPKNKNLRICVSRTISEPMTEEYRDEVICEDEMQEYYEEHLCGRYVGECDPIYISVTGLTNFQSSDCASDLECVFSNQIKFEIKHEGMTCGVCGLTSPTFLLTFASLLLFLRSKAST